MWGLKDDTLSTVLPYTIIFDVNEHGLLFVGRGTPATGGIRMYFSKDHGMTVDTLSPHPSIFTSNQLTRAQARLLPDVFLIYFTYPDGMLSSFDRGDTWDAPHFVDFGLVCIVDENNIFAVGGRIYY